MTPTESAIAALAIGYVLDLALGDPRWLPHPVVGFGRCIHVCDRRMNRGGGRLLKGGLVAVGLTAAAFGLTAALQVLAARVHPLAHLGVTSVGVFFCLANRTLIREGRAVFDAVRLSLTDGRRQLSRIVGRDTAKLDVQQVRTAVLETMSENLNDGVVAPLFYYALLGLPGMVAYKMVNTLDSMIGHKDASYFWFGKTAARLDDVLNLAPARLTALLIALLAASGRSLRFIFAFGHAHESPNSGYPEAALAGVLDARFGGPHTYGGVCIDKPWIGCSARSIAHEEIERVVCLNQRVCLGAVLLVAAACASGSTRLWLT